MNIESKYIPYLKKSHSTDLRNLFGTSDLNSVETHKFTWDKLHRAKQQINELASKIHQNLSESESDERVKEANNSFDGLMQIHEEIIGEMDCRKRLGNNGPRSHGGDPRAPKGEDVEPRFEAEGIKTAVRNTWVDKNGQEVRTYQSNETISKGEEAGISFGGAVRALVLGPRNESEKRALSEGTDSAGGYTVPTPLAFQFIDKVRAQSVAIRSGAITVPMTSETLQIAKLTGDPAFAWRAENAAVSASDPTFSRVLFTAKSCAVLVKCSRELLEDSANVDQMLMQAFTSAAALEVDRAALNGSGASDEPTGILSVSGINTVSMGTNGAAFTNWDEWLDARYELELDNIPGPYSAVMHPRTARDIRKLKTGISSDNTPLMAPQSVTEIAQRITTALPIDETQGTADDASSVIVGNFSELMIGVRNALRIEILKERFADNNQIGFLAHMRLDIQVRHAESFCVINGVIPA